MQAPSRPALTARVPSGSSAKQQLLGSPAAKVAPAWKPNAQGVKDKGKLQEESKILLSRLPMDVGDTEVEVRAAWRFEQNCRLKLTSGVILLGPIQEDSRPSKGGFYHLQLARTIEGDGSDYVRATRGCRGCSRKIRRQVRRSK